MIEILGSYTSYLAMNTFEYLLTPFKNQSPHNSLAKNPMLNGNPYYSEIFSPSI